MNTPRLKDQIKQVFLRTFAYDNIVLAQGLGLCPIIAAGVSLQKGVALTVCTAIALIPCSLLMSVWGKKLGIMRTPLYSVLAMALMVGCQWVLRQYFPELSASLYIFLPLMSVNTLFTYRAGGFSVGRHPLVALTDAVGTSLGFGLVICIVSALRELAIDGALWGVPMGYAARFPEAAYPFAAFILIGFGAAILQQLKKRYSHTMETEEAIIGE